MRLLQRKVINRFGQNFIFAILILFLLSPFFVLAEDQENPYANLTPAEASSVLNRLIANPALVEKLTSERKSQLISTSIFQKTLLDQQKDLLTRRNISQSASLKKIVSVLYAPDAELRVKFEAFTAFSERLEYLIATGNVQSILELRRNPALLPEEKQLLDSSFMGFIRSSIVEKISTKKSAEAINFLIQLPEELWVSDGKALSAQIFGAMVKDEASFTSDQVEHFSDRLASLFQTDPSLKAAVLGIFETSTLQASDRKDSTETMKLLNQIRKFYDNELPGPFVELLLVEHNGGLNHELGENLISELKQRGDLSTKFKMKLMWDGYFGPLVPVLISLSAFFIALAIVVVIFIKIKRKLANVQIENPFKSKKIIPGYMRPIEVESLENEDEYTRLLSMFDLSDAATENEIKKAYRNRMKQLHPDSGKGDIAIENSEEFRDLKHAYDRIIEIRAAWFKGRKSK